MNIKIISGAIPITLLIIALIIFLAGYNNIAGLPLLQGSNFAFAYLAAGQFSVGVFAAGTFAVGIFAAGIFAIGLFSIGIFSIGIFSFGIYAIGIYVGYKYWRDHKESENKKET